MNAAVVIVAGGSGRRMGGEVPKQYLEVAGRPVIVHTIGKFLLYNRAIQVVLVLAREHKSFWESASVYLETGASIQVVYGGTTRFESVKNGLREIGDGMIVGIHDAVRPLVSPETIDRCYRSAHHTGSGIPVTEMDESVRMIRSGAPPVPMDRTRLKRVQTPQVFRSEMIREAYRTAGDPGFTDDASVFETRYGEVTLVAGNTENFKITTPLDLRLARLIMEI